MAQPSPRSASTPGHPPEGNIQRSFLWAAIFWTTAILGLAYFDYRNSQQVELAEAMATARQNIDQVMIMRRWASEHGGVYVPVSPTTPPSPYLTHLPERDIITPSGRTLTLLNPSYVTRQITQLAETSMNIQSHLVSLRPIRPENRPTDPWDELALRILAQGPGEWSELQTSDGQTYLRLMRALPMEPSCLRCHPEPADSAERIRGGITVAIPWEPFPRHFFGLPLPPHFPAYGAVWLLGLLGLEFSRRRLLEHLAQRRRAESSLRQSEERYRLLTESTEAIPWEYDPREARWTYIAPQVERVLGFAPQEWSDLQFWFDQIHEDDRPRISRAFQNAVDHGETLTLDYRFRKKDGGIAWLRNQLSVERTADGPVRLRGVMIDLSEHRTLEEKLRQSAKMEAVGTLAAGVAHDFNNILTSLISFSTLAKRRHPDDAEQQDYLQEILDGAKRAAELTRSLLAYSRKQEVELKPDDLNQIIAKHQKMLRRIIREDIAIDNRLTATALPVLADQAQIEQVVMNLAVNAQDAMPGGGKLTIETSLLERLPATGKLISQPTGGPWAVLTVRDTGSGIPLEDQERIFDPFFTTKEVGKGTGLGLSMVYGIIEQHRGTIRVKSNPGQGSVFQVLLPLQAAAALNRDALAGEEPTRVNGQGATILLAEDEEQVRRVMGRIMELEGYRLLMAADGGEAVELFRRHHAEIDLVVMDVIMPVKNGRDALAAMRLIRPQVKALFVSGYPRDIVSGNAMLGEEQDFISKPVQPADLTAKIREILQRPVEQGTPARLTTQTGVPYARCQ